MIFLHLLLPLELRMIYFFHILVISRVSDLTGLYYALIISYIFDIPLESQFMSSLSI